VILYVLGMFVADLFKSRRRLEAENLFLRHQLNIALRRPPLRLRLYGYDRALFVWITRIWPDLLDLSQVVKPETVLRWHRSGFKAFWRWKSRHRARRPMVDRELRDLIRRMSKENSLWGASRIHGELLMLGFEVAQSTVSKYIVRGRRPPSQTWKTFLRNHAEAEGNGYPRSADLSWISVAKWYCGTSDWHTASRVPGPNVHLRRGAPTPGSFHLCSVLQSSAHALGIAERCAITSSCPTVRRHCCHSNLGRATS
jgi:hypothetical protein